MSAPIKQATEPSIQMLIADRNRMGSQLLAESLAQDPRFKVTVAAAAAEIISLSAASRPDLVVISADLESVSRKGLHTARILSSSHPHINIVILVEATDRDEVIASFRNGARGVFCRTEALSEFKQCALAVSQGQIWVDNGSADYLLDAIKSTPSCEAICHLSTLSKREIEVAEFAAQGLTNKQIADHLGLSEHTVKNYLFRVFEKLKISNRIELLFLLVNEGKINHVPTQGVGTLTLEPGTSIEKYIEAAEDGFVPAQFVLALAHLEGYGTEKSQESAYFWLRITESHCSEILQRSRALVEQLKTEIRTHTVEALEQALKTTLQNKESILSKRPMELVRANKNLLSRLAG